MVTAIPSMTEVSAPASPAVSFVQKKNQLVAGELEFALNECKVKVERIAKDCRSKNRKFRDIEFDLENDAVRCLNGLDWKLGPPPDVQRVTEIFDSPHFFETDSAANSNDIIQGDLGDCWFLSALATVSTIPGLVEKFCVARDEQVGVYGFVFFKDNGWVSVIVDDMLCTSMPKYEELNESEQDLYHGEKTRFNEVARKGGKILTYAKSGSRGGTWVPLIEKAYAKFYGNYAHLDGGTTGEAIEDLTGGVSSVILTQDILDPDKFWKEELLYANKDRLFACSLSELSSSRNGETDVRVQGLMGAHAYSVLRAVECHGKRFVVVRNPWGNSEWTGPWSDGSKEWAGEWLEILPELGHTFGDDGKFIMEYQDFLQCFSLIDRTSLFDSSWVMSSQWLKVPVAPFPAPWSYGDVSYIISIPAPAKTVLVLSQLNKRFFQSLRSTSVFSLDFALVKVGETKPMDVSTHSVSFRRSVNLEINLEAGDYYVYVRIDHSQTVLKPGSTSGLQSAPTTTTAAAGDVDSITANDVPSIEMIDSRQLLKIVSAKVQSQTIADNFEYGPKAKFIPTTLDEVIAQDIERNNEKSSSGSKSFFKKILRFFGIGKHKGKRRTYEETSDFPEDDPFYGLISETPDEVIVGLRVYTKADAPVVIQGRLKADTI